MIELADIRSADHSGIGGASDEDPEELTHELMAAVGRLMRRG